MICCKGGSIQNSLVRTLRLGREERGSSGLALTLPSLILSSRTPTRSPFQRPHNRHNMKRLLLRQRCVSVSIDTENEDDLSYLSPMLAE